MSTNPLSNYPLAILLCGFIHTTASAKDANNPDDVIVVTAKAEHALKQQPGVSIITTDDIIKSAPVNDLSDLIRKMPGVNLTGNSASGSRGNNRQIDIRGMGPENTLILIDGIPVSSRNSVRYSWRGERDSRGDSNWVPAEMVDRIEVLRGPTAARYGSGAAGGVVNIITKKPTNKWSGSVSLYANHPQDGKEGSTKRANFSLSGPLIDDVFTMRLYGNLNKTDGDKADINTAQNGSYAAGREGVRNKDINSQFIWKLSDKQILRYDYGFSRQGNIFAGDTQYSNGNNSSGGLVPELAAKGAETNRMYRQSYSLTHNGFWDWGESTLSAAYEKTNNSRLLEGTSGSVEGMIRSLEYDTSHLNSYRLYGEAVMPLTTQIEQTVTVGAEMTRDTLDDPASMKGTNINSAIIGGVSGHGADRNSKNSANLGALFIENNIVPMDGTNIIVGLRFDKHSQFGGNFSPSLNVSQALNDYFTLKAGIARAFKAPNLYQSSTDYLLNTRGNGCPVTIESGACYLLGNKNLDAEISVNKEVGLAFAYNDFNAGITYFRNDYQNKIIAGTEIVGIGPNGGNILRWENGGKAVIQGIEANLAIPITENSLNWRTNATYMITSKVKNTGNPLSVIPKYTINTMLDWKINHQVSANLAYTFYGRQKPRQFADSRVEANRGINTSELGAYGLTAVGIVYNIGKDVRLNIGIQNLFDKKVYRNNQGAATYNEPGRIYYAGMTASF